MTVSDQDQLTGIVQGILHTGRDLSVNRLFEIVRFMVLMCCEEAGGRGMRVDVPKWEGAGVQGRGGGGGLEWS